MKTKSCYYDYKNYKALETESVIYPYIILVLLLLAQGYMEGIERGLV